MMYAHKSLLSTGRAIHIGDVKSGRYSQKLFVWIPASNEMAAFELKHKATFSSASVTLDELSQALVRWRHSVGEGVDLQPVPWDAQNRIPIPVLGGSRRDGYSVLENASSIATMLRLEAKQVHKPAALVVSGRL